MNYTVVVTDPARESLLESLKWWKENRSVDQAYRWYLGFYKQLETLASMPQRCPLARENDRFSDELRELHYSLGKGVTHRAIFRIDGNKVRVLAVRHASQKDLTVDDIDGE